MPPKVTRGDSVSGTSSNGNRHHRSLDDKKSTGTKASRATSLLKKVVLFSLWNLTKKYEVALKKNEVFAIKEAELDREEIANVFLHLTTPWERILDGRFYKTLATMQHRRDTQLVTPALASQDWIAQFASEVKRRATPLLFLISREVAVPPLALPHADSPVALAEAPTQDDRLSRHCGPAGAYADDAARGGGSGADLRHSTGGGGASRGTG